VGPSVDVRAALARSYLLDELPPEALDPVVPHVRVRRLVRDEPLFHVGDAADELYVVVDGAVKDSVITTDGEEVVHFVHGAGNTLGEPGFFSVERDRIVSVRATRASTVLVLGRAVVERLMADHPELKDKALERLAGQTRFQTSMIAALATSPLERRLLLRILELAEGDGGSTTPEITQSTLAAMVGATRENVNRALGSLVARGIIRKVGSRYALVDEEASRRDLALDFPVGRQRDQRRTADDSAGV
jgi:CRP/FNR family transcriptional regulator, cyclic AMP receptor protein